MHLIISTNSEVPIYEQIKEGIIKEIMSNNLKENEMIPSIRNLACDLRISVMTVKKAYDELEKSGIIVTQHGKGSYIAPRNSAIYREEYQKKIEDNINEIVNLSKIANISKEEVIDTFNFIYGDDK